MTAAPRLKKTLTDDEKVEKRCLDILEAAKKRAAKTDTAVASLIEAIEALTVAVLLSGRRVEESVMVLSIEAEEPRPGG